MKRWIIVFGVLCSPIVGVFCISVTSQILMQPACSPSEQSQNEVAVTGINGAADRDVPKNLLPIFVRAGEKYKVYWQVIAGIAKEECDFGRFAVPACKITHGSDELGPANFAGASGLMQIGIGGGATNMWGTYGVDGNQDGHLSPHNPEDAIFTAANILRKAKNMPALPASIAAIRPAIRGYNGAGPYAEAYADRVLAHAKRWGLQANQDVSAKASSEDSRGGGCAVAASDSHEGTVPGATAKILADGRAVAPEEAPDAVKKMISAGNAIHTKPYVWGGAHGPALDKIYPGYDCSSSVSHVLHAGGVFGAYAWVSGQLATYGEAGKGEWVTIYANGSHVFMEVAGIYFNTARYGKRMPPGTGPRWSTVKQVTSGGGAFAVRHPPTL